MTDTEPVSEGSLRERLMMGAAVLTWAAVGLPYWLLGWSRVVGDSSTGSTSPALWVWTAGHVGFLIALLLTHRLEKAEAPRWASVAMLALQAISALVAAAAFGDSLQAALLVIVATQTGTLLGLRGALIWIGAQSAALAWVLSREFELRTSLAVSAAFVGFQLFGLLTVTMAEREAAARRELARTNAELEAARELLAESSRVAERWRISRELHDGLGHHLTALSLQLEVAGHVGDGKVEQPVARAREIVGRILDDLRRTVRTLRGGRPVDVAASVRGLAGGIPRPEIHLEAAERLVVEDPVRANALVRSVQELITNAVRHSGAGNLWLDLERRDGWLHVEARDDGSGAPRFIPGSGLAGMRERIEGLGGTLELEPRPGEGFRTRLALPLEERQASA